MGKLNWKAESKHLFLEVVLVLGAVMIFRSLWHTLDSIPWFNTPESDLITFIIGVATTVVVFDMLFKHEAKYHNGKARSRHAN